MAWQNREENESFMSLPWKRGYPSILRIIVSSIWLPSSGKKVLTAISNGDLYQLITTYTVVRDCSHNGYSTLIKKRPF